MAHQQDLPRCILLLKRSDHQMLSKAGNVHTFDRIHTLKLARSLDQ